MKKCISKYHSLTLHHFLSDLLTLILLNMLYTQTVPEVQAIGKGLLGKIRKKYKDGNVFANRTFPVSFGIFYPGTAVTALQAMLPC
jgi:hypothetical protein